MGVSNLTVPPTYGRAYAVALAVEQAPDLHEFTVALDVVVDHGRLHEEGVVVVEHAVDALLRLLHEHRALVTLHEGPHPLVHGDLRLLRTKDGTLERLAAGCLIKIERQTREEAGSDRQTERLKQKHRQTSKHIDRYTT